MMQPQQGGGGMQQQTHQVWIKWKKVGSQKPSGQEITNEALATKLQEKLEFTKEEWDAFGIDLRDDFTHVPIIIKSGEQYFEAQSTDWPQRITHTVARKLLPVVICVVIIALLVVLVGISGWDGNPHGKETRTAVSADDGWDGNTRRWDGNTRNTQE